MQSSCSTRWCENAARSLGRLRRVYCTGRCLISRKPTMLQRGQSLSVLTKKNKKRMIKAMTRYSSKHTMSKCKASRQIVQEVNLIRIDILSQQLRQSLITRFRKISWAWRLISNSSSNSCTRTWLPSRPWAASFHSSRTSWCPTFNNKTSLNRLSK